MFTELSKDVFISPCLSVSSVPRLCVFSDTFGSESSLLTVKPSLQPKPCLFFCGEVDSPACSYFYLCAIKTKAGKKSQGGLKEAVIPPLMEGWTFTIHHLCFFFITSFSAVEIYKNKVIKEIIISAREI